MGMDLGLNVLSQKDTKEIDEYTIADEIIVDTTVECPHIDAIGNIMFVKKYIEEHGETDELIMLVGKENLEIIKNYDISNEGLGEVIGRFFKWMGAVFRRVFNIAKTKDEKLDKTIRDLEKDPNGTAAISNLIDYGKANEFRDKLNSVVATLKRKALKPEEITDEDVASAEQCKQQIDEMIKEMSNGEDKEISNSGAVKYFKNLKALIGKATKDANDFEQWSKNLQARVESKGQVAEDSKYRNVLKMAQFITQSYAMFIKALYVDATPNNNEQNNEEDTSDTDAE